MTKKLSYRLLPLFFCLISNFAMADEVAVIGHKTLHKLDEITIQKLFTGRIIEIEGQPITVVNAKPGSAARNKFLASYLDQDEEKYIAYWTVRRFIGKGRPPRDVDPSSAVIQFVQTTPGAIGYIDTTDLQPDLNILNKK